MPQLIFDSFPYDCAYEFVSPTHNVKKIGLFEINITTNQLRVYRTGEIDYFRLYPLEEVEGIAGENQEESLNLALLPKLRLDFRQARSINIPVTTLKTPILLVNMVYFKRNNILFRDGFSGVFAIEKVICENGNEDIVYANDFRPRRCHYLKGDSLERFSNQDSIHNRLFSEFTFRCTLNDYFQNTLHNVRGQSKNANFLMDNVSSDSAFSLFSFLRKRFIDKGMTFHEDILIGSIDKETKKRKDVLYAPQNNDLRIAMTKVDQYIIASETMVVSVPFAEMLVGYLPSHFNLYPEKLDLQRKFTPSLEGLLFDHIPNDSIIRFEYNSLCSTLHCKFSVGQLFYPDIACSSKLFDTTLTEYTNNLVNKAFYDPLFDWTVIVLMVEYNTNLFYEENKRKGYFVAWCTRIENLKDKTYIASLKNDKQNRETSALPYDPQFFDVSSMLHDLSSATERQVKDHQELVKQFSNAASTVDKNETTRMCGLQSSSKQVTSERKRKYNTPIAVLSPPKRLSVQRKDRRIDSGSNYRVNIEIFVELAMSKINSLLEHSEASAQVTLTDDGSSSRESTVAASDKMAGQRYFCNSMNKYLTQQTEYYSKIVSDADLLLFVEYLLTPFNLQDIKKTLRSLFPDIQFESTAKTMNDYIKCLKSYIIGLKEGEEEEEEEEETQSI